MEFPFWGLTLLGPVSLENSLSPLILIFHSENGIKNTSFFSCAEKLVSAKLLFKGTGTNQNVNFTLWSVFVATFSCLLCKCYCSEGVCWSSSAPKQVLTGRLLPAAPGKMVGGCCAVLGVAPCWLLVSSWRFSTENGKASSGSSLLPGAVSSL